MDVSTAFLFVLVTAGVTPGGDTAEALHLDPFQADGGGAEQPPGDAGGRGGG